MLVPAVLDSDGNGGDPLVPHLLGDAQPLVPHLLPVWLLEVEEGLVLLLPCPEEPVGVSPRERQGVELDRKTEAVPIE